MKIAIPREVSTLLTILEEKNFEAFIVGGCVRDTLLKREPRDWDITTNALPERLLELFPDSFYENSFGTVSVKVAPFLKTGDPNREHDIIEITTYRSEAHYTDGRHPSLVTFEDTLEKDLSRRDFTINAMAYGQRGGYWQLVDPFMGQQDLHDKVLRTVGDANERFQEDALRLLRAIRLVTELRAPKKDDYFNHDWIIAKETADAILAHAKDLGRIAKERIQDELNKILLSQSPAYGIQLLKDTELLSSILPDLAEGVGVEQNLHHIYTVWEHNLRTLATCPSHKLEVRLACLLHDVAKPRTKRGQGRYATFYNHDHVGARMTKKLLENLKYPLS